MKKLIVANWKMYLTLSQSKALAKRISNFQFPISKSQIVLCPSFVALPEVAKIVRGTTIKLGAQDVDPEARGAHTGAVGLDDLAEIGVQYVLVGHSERRAKGEDDALINRKLKAVLKAGMRPILCVGEPFRAPTPPLPPPLTRTTPGPSLERRGNEWAHRYVTKQLRAGLKGVSEKDLRRVIIAYEPVWAIGTGNPATPEIASAMHDEIRKNMPIKTIPILYGGSVDAKNAADFLGVSGVDGLLVGSASTRAVEFLDLLARVA